MKNEWQTDLPRLSPDEADHVVELWLRRRLNGSEEIPVESHALSLRELSQALGAREDEVVALLAQIRAKQHPRVRAAIPVQRSWHLILAIYAAVALLGCAFFAWRVSAVRIGQGVSAAEWNAMNGRPGAFRIAAMPRGFGFSYRGYVSPEAPIYSDGQVDWAKGEKALLDQIVKINAQGATTYEPLVSPEEIASALSPNFRQSPEYGPPDNMETPSESRLVEWRPLSVNVNGHEMRTILPSAKVANASVENAVRQDIKSRVSGMLKALQARLTPNSTNPNDSL
ncbi:MAG: hypothetical protein ACHQ50_04505 [Fimbriimonadales bacterium]